MADSGQILGLNTSFPPIGRSDDVPSSSPSTDPSLSTAAKTEIGKFNAYILHADEAMAIIKEFEERIFRISESGEAEPIDWASICRKMSLSYMKFRLEMLHNAMFRGMIQCCEEQFTQYLNGMIRKGIVERALEGPSTPETTAELMTLVEFEARNVQPNIVTNGYSPIEVSQANDDLVRKAREKKERKEQEKQALRLASAPPEVIEEQAKQVDAILKKADGETSQTDYGEV